MRDSEAIHLVSDLLPGADLSASVRDAHRMGRWLSEECIQTRSVQGCFKNKEACRRPAPESPGTYLVALHTFSSDFRIS